MTERFTEREQAIRAKKLERAAACHHDWFVFKPVCRGYHVAGDIEYTVHGCRQCHARADIMESGEVFRIYVPALPNERLKTQDGAFYDDPSVYNPQFDGIDAFNESEDTSEPSNLFDTRGGIGGIGD